MTGLWSQLRTGSLFLLLLGGCLGRDGEPAGPILSWTGSVHGTGDGDSESDDDEQGHDDDETSDEMDSSDPDQTKEVSACLQMQVTALRSKLNTCRACHTRTGLAKEAEFLLTSDASQDAQRLLLAYDELGIDLLRIPADETSPKHRGGKRLAKGTDAYESWQELMMTLDDPEACVP